MCVLQKSKQILGQNYSEIQNNTSSIVGQQLFQRAEDFPQIAEHLYVQDKAYQFNALKQLKQFLLVRLIKHEKIIILIVSLLVIAATLYFYNRWPQKINCLVYQHKLSTSNQRLQKFVINYKQSHLQFYQKYSQSYKFTDNYYHQCPKVLRPFYVNLNKNDRQLNNLSENYKIIAQKCKIKIIGLVQFQKLVIRWNSHQDEKILDLHKLDIQNQQILLALLQLYYEAGSFINYELSFSKINNRCWSLTVFDFDILFASTKEILNNGIRVPSFQSIIRTKFPYTPMVKNMIKNMINHKRYDQQCRQRQCLIVQCSQQQFPLNPVIQNRRQIVQQFSFENSKFNNYIYRKNDKQFNKYEKSQELQIEAGTSYNILSFMTPFRAVEITYTSEQSIILQQWFNNTNQIFQFISHNLDGNQFKIYNKYNKKVLKINGELWGDKPQVVFDHQKHQQDQIWKLVKLSQINPIWQQQIDINDVYYIQSYCGKVLTALYNQRVIGTKILLQDLKTDNSSIGQLWFIQQSYRPQIQKINIQQYKQSLSNQIYNSPSILTFKHLRKILYLRKKLIELSEQTPFWLPQAQYFPQESDLPFNRMELVADIKTGKISQTMPVQCAKKHQIAYVWLGKKQLPLRYKHIIESCGANARLLTDSDFEKYSKMWNNFIQNQKYLISNESVTSVQKIDLLKLLYLYFQSGVYADFDTQINEKCFQNIFTQDVIWTNNCPWPGQNIFQIPEENFMKVQQRHHPQIKFQIQGLLFQKKSNDRWKQCKGRQCLIVNCQRHLLDNSWK